MSLALQKHQFYVSSIFCHKIDYTNTTHTLKFVIDVIDKSDRVLINILHGVP